MRTGGYRNVFGYEMPDLYEDHQYDKVHPDDVTDVIQSINDAINQ